MSVVEPPRLNLDELYESKKKQDMNRLEIYTKLLAKIHTKIKTASRQRNSNQFCHYVMPEVLVGYPNYDFAECLAFIVDRLQTDGFLTRYVHPNLLMITWNHYIPRYVREEYKKKTGQEIDEFGNVLQKKSKVHFEKSSDKSVYDDDLLKGMMPSF
jgi:hypothetical protein